MPPALQIVEYNLKSEMEHGLYVSRLASQTARELGLGEEEIREIAIAGLLHDIGKLRLMRVIRGEERDPLVTEQMKYVRMHSSLSYEIVKEHGYSEYILDCVRRHHENYDGSGYPEGIAGENIPLGARILRVCDVFAALTTDRPYRKAFQKDAAMELMIAEIAHFDVRVFLAFQRVVKRAGTSDYRRLDEQLFEEKEITEEMAQ